MGIVADVLANDPASDAPDPVLPLDPVAVIDQMLRRALRVGPALGADPIDSDTWAAAAPVTPGFWDDGVRRPRRLPAGWRARLRPTVWLRWTESPQWRGRARLVGATLLVAGLAGGWLATSALGNGRSHARAAAAPVAPAPRADHEKPVSPPDQPRELEHAGRSLRALVPAGATCGYGPASANQAHCAIGAVRVEYSLLGAGALRAGYLAAVGSVSRPASGEPACAKGAEDERSWSRPTLPRLAVGRYACRIEQGRAAMWWTVDDRGLLAHATSAGADLASLFAWWASHAER